MIDSEEISTYDTYDIQHDLAMFYADGETNEDFELNKAYYDELVKRGAAIPTNCKWVYCSYSLGKQKLEFDL